MSFWSDMHLLEPGGGAEALLQKVARITTYSTEARFVWRGHGDLSWGLHSGAYRRLERGKPRGSISEQGVRRYEAELTNRAMRGGYLYSAGLSGMGTLQHQGTATRFVDVTSDPMIAVWFACELQEKTGAVFAFEVSRARVFDRPDDDTTMAVAVDSLADEQLGLYEPKLDDDRIKRQRGKFIFGRVPNEPRSYRRYVSVPVDIPEWTARERMAVFGMRERGRPRLPTVLVLKVNASAKAKLLRHFQQSFGYTRESMFPDLAGFARANSAEALLDGF